MFWRTVLQQLRRTYRIPNLQSRRNNWKNYSLLLANSSFWTSLRAHSTVEIKTLIDQEGLVGLSSSGRKRRNRWAGLIRTYDDYVPFSDRRFPNNGHSSLICYLFIKTKWKGFGEKIFCLSKHSISNFVPPLISFVMLSDSSFTVFYWLCAYIDQSQRYSFTT